MRVPTHIIATTERLLAKAGERGEEGLVLWLGCGNDPSSIYAPSIVAGPRHFRVPTEEVCKLIQHCSANNVRLLAQVHSHPDKAFHSPVDDRDALVTRVGGLSIVLPRFAKEGFTAADLRVYQMSEQGWLEAPRSVVTW